SRLYLNTKRLSQT
ncbi:multidrug transporter MatE, partial [Acinetobacter sp. V2]